MSSSWKIGAKSGLIAGIFGFIVFTIFAKIGASIGLFEPYWREIIPNSLISNMIVGIMFGVILGIIFSKVCSIIPGKHILKGLIFGLIIYLIYEIRSATFWVAYGYYLDVMGTIFSAFFVWIAFGLVLGFSYDLLQRKYYPTIEEPKVVTYDMKNGFIPGAIAGIVTGLVASFANAVTFMIGIFKISGAPTTFTFDFWLGQSGSHIFIHIIWGIIFGAIFAKVYNLVPSKGIIKGLCYSLTLFLITTFHGSCYSLGWGLTYSNWTAVYTSLWASFVSVFSLGITYGLVLGYLYKKPGD